MRIIALLFIFVLAGCATTGSGDPINPAVEYRDYHPKSPAEIGHAIGSWGLGGLGW